MAAETNDGPMSADEDDAAPTPPSRRLSPEDSSALWWLARWIGLPLVVVIAIFYAEPLFRSRQIDVVPTVLRQEVHPYPFPPGATVAPLAPPEVPRAPPAEPAPPIDLISPPSSSEIAASPLSQPQPRYPTRALEAEKEGIVRVRITIAPDGSVSDAVVVGARPTGWFESATLDAVKRWRYRPSDRTISTEVEIEFKLN